MRCTKNNRESFTVSREIVADAYRRLCMFIIAGLCGMELPLFIKNCYCILELPVVNKTINYLRGLLL